MYVAQEEFVRVVRSIENGFEIIYIILHWFDVSEIRDELKIDFTILYRHFER